MDKKIRIAVFGSWRGPDAQQHVKAKRELDVAWTNKNNIESFKTACRELGREIACAGHVVLVASDSPSTVDYHVVQGVIDAKDQVQSNHSPLHVIRSRAPRSSKSDEDCSKIMTQAVEQHPELFDEPEFHQGTFDDADRASKKWEQVHDYIASSADTVLVIGGGAGTHRTANRALGESKSVVPIGTFGGAGEELIRMLENVRDASSVPRYDYRQVLREPNWGLPQLNTSLYALGVRRDPRLRRKVFINYRRADSNTMAYLLHRELKNELDADDVFLDHKSIGGGEQFSEVIEEELGKSSVMLTLIGPDWLTIADAQTGQRRLDAKADYVRQEIEIAIRDNIHIIPVCIDGVQVPPKGALPDSIACLPDLNACFISQDDIEFGIKDLLIEVRKYL